MTPCSYGWLLDLQSSVSSWCFESTMPIEQIWYSFDRQERLWSALNWLSWQIRSNLLINR